MRVLHLLKTSIGASWGLRQMGELVKIGVDVHVALPPGPMVVKYKKAGVTTHECGTALSVRRPHDNLAIFRRIRRLVREVNPDIIHSHFVANTIAMRLALGKDHPAKRIFHVPGPLHLEHCFFRNMEILSAGSNDFWLASCEWTRQRYIRSGIDPSRLGLVYYGVELSEPPVGRVGRLRQEFGVDPNAPVIGNVAYFYAPKRYLGQKVGLKGHEDLIAAVELAGRHIPGLTCFLVGGPWDGSDHYFERIRLLAERITHARIILTGYRADVHDIYQDFDVAVHPSHSENIGGAVESLLHEIPTIATNVGGFPDLIHPGVTGWLVPPKAPQALANSIQEALERPDEATRRAKAGRRLVEDLLDVRENARELVMYYKNLLATGSLTPKGWKS